MYLGFDGARGDAIESHPISCPLTGEGFDHGVYSSLGSCTRDDESRASLSVWSSDSQKARTYKIIITTVKN